MGFIQAPDSNSYREEEGEGRPIILTHPPAFRETAYRRWRRQVTTLVRVARAGRARAKADPRRHVAPVDAAALRDLVATVAADARVVQVPLNQPPWTLTGLAVTRSEEHTSELRHVAISYAVFCLKKKKKKYTCLKFQNKKKQTKNKQTIL